MEPGEKYNLGHVFVFPASHYAAKIVFVGDRATAAEFWSRIIYFGVPPNQALFRERAGLRVASQLIQTPTDHFPRNRPSGFKRQSILYTRGLIAVTLAVGLGWSLMKILFFMGRNARNRSGFSWKFWKVARRGKSVTTHWGPAKLHMRRVLPESYTKTLTRKFRTLTEAIAHENRLIESKERKGYQRRTRWR
jgi:predicted DNA-binding WGR domain protein